MNPTCPQCGKVMYQHFDNIAQKYSGHIWICGCMPNRILAIGTTENGRKIYDAIRVRTASKRVTGTGRTFKKGTRGDEKIKRL